MNRLDLSKLFFKSSASSFYLFGFALVIICYAFGLNSPPFGDDLGFVFNSKLTGAKSPLEFFDGWGDPTYSRTWPLSFSGLWIMHKLFGETYFAYKLVNLILHFFNFILVERIFAFIKPQASRLIALLFLIHPMVAESVLWIFQFKTVLSVTFFLLAYWCILLFRQKNYSFILLSLFFFLLSLITKVVALFMPFVFLFHLKGKHKWLIIPFLLLSAKQGLRSLDGAVTWGKADKFIASSFHETIFKKSNEPIVPPMETKHIPKLPDTPKASFPPAVTTKTYIQDLVTNLSSLGVKVGLLGQTYFFYLSHYTGFFPLYFIYPKFKYDNWSHLSVLISFVLIFSSLLYFHHGLIFYLLAFLPISGLFYVPYFRHSFVADHWNYLGLIGLSVLFYEIGTCLPGPATLRRILQMSFILLLVLMTSFQTYSFRDLKSTYERNLAINPKAKILHEYRMQILLNEVSEDSPLFKEQLKLIYANQEIDYLSPWFTPGESLDLIKIKVFFQLGLIDQAQQLLQKELQKPDRSLEAVLLAEFISKKVNTR